MREKLDHPTERTIGPALIVDYDRWGPLVRWRLRHGRISKQGWGISFEEEPVLKRASGVYVGLKKVYELKPG